ncbi:MAG: hypothetical protein LAP40_16450 [Acidobacteriia bacterium]|nr:hypothetical protein [Terriglobia bacterium]
MWRSYYGHTRLRLAQELVELLHDQFRLPFSRLVAGAYHAARAAAVFQDGHNRAGYQRALPHLVSYYRLIRGTYHQPESYFASHASTRAEAMLLRDQRQEAGMVSEQDWSRIGELLDTSWASLQKVVSAP